MIDYTNIGDFIPNQSLTISNYPYTRGGNSVDYGPVTNPTYYWPYYQTVEREVEPKSCMGKAHVFECEHVDACKCGAIKRVMPRAKAQRKRKA